jgi:D-arabinose 5-phosphate isomerase GutQ
VEHVKSVHTNGGRDVLLGSGYMGLLGSNISMCFFSVGTRA